MNWIIGILITLLCVVLGTYITMIMAWVTHIDLNDIENGKARIWVTYKELKKIFDAHRDEYTFNEWSQDSIFSRNGKHRMICEMVRINDVIYYLRTPLNFVLFQCYTMDFIRENSPYVPQPRKFTKLKDYKGEL